LDVESRGVRDALRRQRAVEGVSVAEEVRAEMAANVLKVLVRVGDPVVAGTTLVLLESMKMEIPVLAEAEGTVTAVTVSEGDVVQEGDSLVELA
jgi:biotin carboxyl carrier protein